MCVVGMKMEPIISDYSMIEIVNMVEYEIHI